MKTAILVLLFISPVFTNNSQSQWVHLPNGSGAGVSLANNGNNFYCGTWFTGISLTTNSGNSWTWLGPMYTVRGILINGNNIFAATDHNGIFLTTSNGSSWSAVNNGLTDHATGTLVGISGYLFAGTHTVNIGTVYRSSDNGASWQVVNNGLSNHTISYLSSSGSDIFASTYGSGIFLSTNLGESWSAINNGLTDLYVAPIVFSSNKIFAGTLYEGVFVSTNNGDSWVQRNNGLNYSNIDALAVSGNFIFAGVGTIGTGTGGVYVTSNDGQSWTAINDGLTIGNEVYLYSLITTDSRIYVGMSNGIWSRPLIEITSIQKHNSGVPESYNLFQNYPNPFNPSTKIKFDIPSAGKNLNVKLAVFDVLGREIEVLLNNVSKPGSYEIEWNASGYPSGVYFYKLVSGGYTETRKMVLLK